MPSYFPVTFCFRSVDKRLRPLVSGSFADRSLKYETNIAKIGTTQTVLPTFFIFQRNEKRRLFTRKGTDKIGPIKRNRATPPDSRFIDDCSDPFRTEKCMGTTIETDRRCRHPPPRGQRCRTEALTTSCVGSSVRIPASVSLLIRWCRALIASVPMLLIG